MAPYAQPTAAHARPPPRARPRPSSACTGQLLPSPPLPGLPAFALHLLLLLSSSCSFSFELGEISIRVRLVRIPLKVLAIDERLDAHGSVLQALDLENAEQHFQSLYDSGIRSIAIVLMHGYRYPQHELALGDLARRIGFTQVSLGHQVSPLMKLVSRGDTTVVDAYLSPILRQYVEQVSDQLGAATLMFMQSNGGLVSADLFQGKDSVLSGPAGGIVGAVNTPGSKWPSSRSPSMASASNGCGRKPVSCVKFVEKFFSNTRPKNPLVNTGKTLS